MPQQKFHVHTIIFSKQRCLIVFSVFHHAELVGETSLIRVMHTEYTFYTTFNIFVTFPVFVFCFVNFVFLKHTMHSLMNQSTMLCRMRYQCCSRCPVQKLCSRNPYLVLQSLQLLLLVIAVYTEMITIECFSC